MFKGCVYDQRMYCSIMKNKTYCISTLSIRFRDQFNYITLHYCHKEVRNSVPVANLCLRSGITCPDNWAFPCLNSAVDKTNSAVVKTKISQLAQLMAVLKRASAGWLSAALRTYCCISTGLWSITSDVSCS